MFKKCTIGVCIMHYVLVVNHIMARYKIVSADCNPSFITIRQIVLLLLPS